MKPTPPKDGASTEYATDINKMNHKTVRERADESSVAIGRSAQGAFEFDGERADRELKGESGLDPNETVLESAPESERWNPVPGSTGHKVAVAPSADEDDEGRSAEERLVEEGIAGAEHDQRVQATKEAAKVDS